MSKFVCACALCVLLLHMVYSQTVSCPGNGYSIISLIVSANIVIDHSSRILSISSSIVVDNGDNFDQRSSLLSSCIDLLELGGRFCSLDFGGPHHFELPSDYIDDSVHIVSSLCTNGGDECFCSANTNVVLKYHHFTVLSPQPSQRIVTDYLLLFAQTNSSSFSLGSFGLLCIEVVFRSNMLGNYDSESGLVAFSNCFDNFPETVSSSTNNSLIELISINSGNWDVIFSSTSGGLNSVVYQRVVIPVAVISPDECAAFSNSFDDVQKRDEILMVDSTFYFDGVDDMMLIRLAEHAPYLSAFVPVEANETHNGTARGFTLFNDRTSQFNYDYALENTFNVAYDELLSIFKNRSSIMASVDGDIAQVWVTHMFVNSSKGSIASNDMAKESQQRDALLSTLNKRSEHHTGDVSRDREYMLVSDTDEVLRQTTLNKIRHCKILSDYAYDRNKGALPHMTVHLLHHYMYNFNYKLSERWGLSDAEGAYTVAAELFDRGSELTPTKVRRLFRHENRATLFELAKRSNIAVWKDSGWHMSAFKSPSEYAMLRQYYPGERNTEFFTVEHTTMLQDLGLSAYDLQNPTEALLEMSMAYQPVDEETLPLLLRRHQAFHERFVPSRVQLSVEERRAMIITLQQAYKRTRPENLSDIVFIKPDKTSNKVLEYTVGCVLSPDSIRRGDRDEIDRVICCAECEPAILMKGNVKCSSIYEYADYRCAVSSNDRVSLTVILE